MRILVVNDGFGDGGGVQSYLDAVVRGLIDRRHAVAFLHYDAAPAECAAPSFPDLLHTSVAASGLAGLYLAPGGDARATFGIGFITLALVWLYTGAKAYVAIRRGDVAAHRRWMIRNYALTYAAVTLRVEMPLLIVGGLSPVVALNVVSWLCWVPNLLVVEAWLRRRRVAAA